LLDLAPLLKAGCGNLQVTTKWDTWQALIEQFGNLIDFSGETAKDRGSPIEKRSLGWFNWQPKKPSVRIFLKNLHFYTALSIVYKKAFLKLY